VNNNIAFDARLPASGSGAALRMGSTIAILCHLKRP
jgi:hypothetical protein